ncbi:MAG TPA: pitrilysin family protein [Puia sp.]|jgi:predicted Zn-dependent peptidase|nr:pitrilysin family protein [Puia sp.]
MAVQANRKLNRKVAPAVKDAKEFELELPPYVRYTLSNGVEVYAIDLGKVDAMMVSWIFDAGNSYETGKGVAAAANSLLKNGTTTRKAFDISEHFDYYGAYLSRACHHETAELTLHCLNLHFQELVPVVAELLTESVYPGEELAIYKKNAQQRLQVNLKKSDFVAGRLIDSYLYGETHPYGRFNMPEDYQALDREALVAYYRRYYQSGACRIIAAGKLPGDLIPLLEKYFGPLPLGKPAVGDEAPFFPIVAAGQKKYRVTNDPDGVQGSIRIARNFPNRHHPDFQRVQVLNNVFGGFFGSRLMTNIREDKGYTYGIYSYLVNNRQESALMISTEAGKEVAEAAIGEVYKEMNLLREELIDEEELQMARNFAIGTVLGDLDGPFHVASRWKSILLNGLDENYFREGIRIVKTITPEELRELAVKWLDPAAFFELVVV